MVVSLQQVPYTKIEVQALAFMLLLVVVHYLGLLIVATYTQLLNVKQYALKSQIVWDTIL